MVNSMPYYDNDMVKIAKILLQNPQSRNFTWTNCEFHILQDKPAPLCKQACHSR